MLEQSKAVPVKCFPIPVFVMWRGLDEVVVNAKTSVITGALLILNCQLYSSKAQRVYSLV